jgi:hypothetical protein
MDKLANDQGGYLSAIFVGMFRLTLTSFSWSTEYLARQSTMKLKMKSRSGKNA